MSNVYICVLVCFDKSFQSMEFDVQLAALCRVRVSGVYQCVAYRL